MRLSADERAWAKFNEAKPGSFRLYPNESQIDGLRKDYAEMGADDLRQNSTEC